MESLSLVELINVGWPILLGVGGVMVASVQLFSRVQALEEKVKTLFSLFNRDNK